MLEITVKWLPFGTQAITLWPFVLYLPAAYADSCTRVHEAYHWHDALKWGVVPWYATYLIIGIFYIGRPAAKHPLEAPAYRAARKCRLEK